ncbi:MAG: hypothetical protein JW774_06295 [Candidatus Aureabacteria bacterium]|nr:hypothetical protein [Candidatus Auribacterota bacterium]
MQIFISDDTHAICIYLTAIFFFLFFSPPSSSADTMGAIFPVKSKKFYEMYRLMKDELKDNGHILKFVDSDSGDAEVKQYLKDEGVTQIVCIGNKSALIGKESGLPGLFLFVVGPFKEGIMRKDGIPTANLTGIDVYFSPQLIYDILNKIFPQITFGIVYNPDQSEYYLGKLREFSTGRYSLVEKAIHDSSDVIPSFNKMKGKVNFIFSFLDLTVFNPNTLDFLYKFSIMNRISLIGINEVMTKNGALISFSFDYPALAKQAVRILIKMNSGVKPQDIQMEFPDKITYTLNLNTAKIFNITIPDDIIKGAEQTFEFAS